MKSSTAFPLSLLLVIATSFTACAGDKELGRSFRATAAGFTFDQGAHSFTIPINTAISDWRVNCSRTRAVAWGRAQDLEKVGAPPVTRIYALNLEKRTIISSFTVTRGPFEVIFDQGQKWASVDDYVIDQNSGEIVGMTEDFKFPGESCATHP